MDLQQDLFETVTMLKQYLEEQKSRGVKSVVVEETPARPLQSEDGGVRGKADRLDQMQQEVMRCQRCLLHATKTNYVFGEGSPDARLMFIGEAPGEDEDRQARPFVGRAGQLLTRIIQSIGLERDQVYIANILKCRPPANRNPAPAEIAACQQHLLSQIEIIQPEVICALGSFAAQTLLKTDQGISRLRGRFHVYDAVKLMPTYHPAYLLRNSGGKRLVWADMKRIKAELGI